MAVGPRFGDELNDIASRVGHEVAELIVRGWEKNVTTGRECIMTHTHVLNETAKSNQNERQMPAFSCCHVVIRQRILVSDVPEDVLAHPSVELRGFNILQDPYDIDN